MTNEPMGEEVPTYITIMEGGEGRFYELLMAH